MYDVLWVGVKRREVRPNNQNQSKLVASYLENNSLIIATYELNIYFHILYKQSNKIVLDTRYTFLKLKGISKCSFKRVRLYLLQVLSAARKSWAVCKNLNSFWFWYTLKV